MLPAVTVDLWEYLQKTDKTVVLYGMGNGGDKVMDACASKGIAVSGVFASDGFARGNLFHGMPVRSWSETKAVYGAENLIVLLCFGTSRPEVLENILRIASEAELYAPDVPAFGDGLFDRAFFEAHREKLERARALFCDEESVRIFDNVLWYKLTGDIRYLLDAESDTEEIREHILQPEGIRFYADLGAYNGDTVREILECAPQLERVYALEPDARNYKKLEAYAKTETRAEVRAINAGAWCESTTLYFDKSGNRNASFGVNRSQSLEERPVKLIEVRAEPLDCVLDGERVDYIKYDVEGSERKALLGSQKTVARWMPTMLVSLYHRNEDLFSLPMLIHELFPDYRGYYLRRMRGVPAWDLNLYVKKDG